MLTFAVWVIVVILMFNSVKRGDIFSAVNRRIMDTEEIKLMIESHFRMLFMGTDLNIERHSNGVDLCFRRGHQPNASLILTVKVWKTSNYLSQPVKLLVVLPGYGTDRDKEFEYPELGLSQMIADITPLLAKAFPGHTKL